jgi:hypothetical protein
MHLVQLPLLPLLVLVLHLLRLAPASTDDGSSSRLQARRGAAASLTARTTPSPRLTQTRVSEDVESELMTPESPPVSRGQRTALNENQMTKAVVPGGGGALEYAQCSEETGHSNL